MSDIPEEDNAALQKRKAIQALMRDKSLSGAERNKRMQQIMSGKFSAAELPKEPEPTPAKKLPQRELGRRSSSAKELIEKFQEIEKAAKSPPEPKPHFSSIASFGHDGGRGIGKEEIHDDYGVHSPDSPEKNAMTEEEKRNRAFIPATLFSSNKKFLEERVERASAASKHDVAEPTSATSKVGAFQSEPKGSMDQFEQRIMKKSMTDASNTSSKAGAPGGSASSASMDQFEHRIMKKSMTDASNTSSKAGAPGGSASRASMDQFEQRVLQKSMSNGNTTSSKTGMPGGSDRASMDQFEQRILQKSMSNGSPTSSKTGTMDQLEKRIMQKSMSSNVSNSSSKTGNVSMDEFQERILRKSSIDSSDSASKPSLLAQSELSSFEQRVLEKAKAKSGDQEKNYQNSALSSFEQRIQEKARSNPPVDSSLGKAPPVIRDASAFDPDDFVQQEEEATPRASDAIQFYSPARAQNRLESNENLDEVPPDEPNWRELEISYNDDSRPRGGSVGTEESGRGFVQEQAPLDGDGVGFGSLPLPEEHFSTDRYPPLEQIHSADEINGDNGGLAVATAVAPDDEPDYVYNAIEYDPDAKPPLHRNRRFRVYTYFSLVLIAVMAVLVVVKITTAAKQEEIVYEEINHQNSPSLSPTSSPITDREASGILEQLEGGVLYVRDQKFSDMERGDPRILALDWILHKDAQQLVSDDVNLYQRFALSVLAYSMDSRAWTYCGDPGEDYTKEECPIATKIDANTTIMKSYGLTWLSSASECDWFGVTCSTDGVVRGVDLSYNELIGELPYELTALAFIQALALSHNCIFGTIPPELGQMSHLLSLELHGNGLSGEMPQEIYDLEKLQLLNLAEQYGGERECNSTDGKMVDIKYRLGGLTWPREENVGLTGTLGDQIGVWRSMKGLYLHKNSFEGMLSPEIGNLRYLRFLWLSDNFIAGSLPSTITKLRNLRHLRLSENFLVSSLPADLGRMNDIEILEVNGNSMFGEIPDGLYKMQKLTHLRLDDTMMAKEPWLTVPDEGFTGTISTLIGTLKDLEWLILTNNPLSGTIPTELGLCENLSVFRVHRTNVAGSMPQEICMLRDKYLNSETGTGVLYSDCRPNNRTDEPFLKCDCCSDCCDHTTGVCIADD